MARVQDNWERLVRATLRREQLRATGPGHERHPSGLASAVPPSLDRTSNINAILQAADEIQDQDPSVARIYGQKRVLDDIQAKLTLEQVKSKKQSKKAHKYAKATQDMQVQMFEWHSL